MDRCLLSLDVGLGTGDIYLVLRVKYIACAILGQQCTSKLVATGIPLLIDFPC